MSVCAHVVGSVAHPQRPEESVRCLALSPSASFSWGRVLPSPELTISARLAHQQAYKIHLSSSLPPMLQAHMVTPGFYVGVKHLNSGLRACTARAHIHWVISPAACLLVSWPWISFHVYLVYYRTKTPGYPKETQWKILKHGVIEQTQFWLYFKDVESGASFKFSFFYIGHGSFVGVAMVPSVSRGPCVCLWHRWEVMICFGHGAQ